MTDDYLAFLVRFQRRRGDQHWRSVLKNVTTNEERHFATLNAAIDFLLQELDVNRDDSPDDANQE